MHLMSGDYRMYQRSGQLWNCFNVFWLKGVPCADMEMANLKLCFIVRDHGFKR